MLHIDRVLEDIRQGVPVIVVDEYERENEGDLVVSVEKATYENIHLMVMAGGLSCIAASGEILDSLQIPQMVDVSNDPLETPFTVSVDSMRVTTGVSVDDRLRTIEVFANSNSLPGDLIRPGHMFPLRARSGLLRDRQGHTEGSVTLMKLAGLRESAVICEIMAPDGSMARLESLKSYARNHGPWFKSDESTSGFPVLEIISIKEIHRVAKERGIL